MNPKMKTFTVTFRVTGDPAMGQWAYVVNAPNLTRATTKALKLAVRDTNHLARELEEVPSATFPGLPGPGFGAYNDTRHQSKGRRTSDAERWNTEFTRTEQKLAAITRQFPPVPIDQRCDFACSGAIVSMSDDCSSHVERCDACKRFQNDSQAEEFVTLVLQAVALGVEIPS